MGKGISRSRTRITPCTFHYATRRSVCRKSMSSPQLYLILTYWVEFFRYERQTYLQQIPAQFNNVQDPLPLGYLSTEVAWYFQDEMKLRSNLTVRLGLRHEMTNGWNEVADRCSNYVFDKNFVISTEPRIGHSCLTENHAKLLLQPRVGIAWDPTGRGTWAVRAGFRIHNDLQDNVGNRAYPNPPSNAREQLA